MQYYDNLVGPVSYKKLYGYNKTIHMFGDLHSKEPIKCKRGKDIDFTSFLHYYLTKYERNGVIVDVFVEITPVLKSYPTDEQYDIPKTVDFTVAGVYNSGLIEDLAVKFYGCMNKSDDIRIQPFIKEKVYYNCDFHHRFHNIDIRGLMTSDFPFFLFIRDIFEIYRTKGYHETIIDIINKTEFPIFEEYISKLKIIKQLKNCEETVAKKLFLYYKQSYIYQKTNIIKAIKEKDYKTIIESLYIISGNMMDLYTIARIMRKFKDGTYPKDIIIIAGNKHIEHIMKTFIELFNFDLVNDIQNNFKKCLPIKEMNI